MSLSKFRFAVPLCVILIAVTLSGCSYRYAFELEGTVRSAKDGEPIKGVTVTLKVNDADAEFSRPLVFLKDGQFEGEFRVGDSVFFGKKLPTFTLVLSKDGYFDEHVDISPKKDPGETDELTRFVVVAYMRHR